jgi:hypothetical protein
MESSANITPAQWLSVHPRQAHLDAPGSQVAATTMTMMVQADLAGLRALEVPRDLEVLREVLEVPRDLEVPREVLEAPGDLEVPREVLVAPADLLDRKASVDLRVREDRKALVAQRVRFRIRRHGRNANRPIGGRPFGKPSHLLKLHYGS